MNYNLINIVSVIFTGWLGAILGSYVNMAAYRLPRGISTVTKTRSFCPSCQKQIAWYDNIPILSYLILLGRCRHCKTRISVRYLFVELLVTALFVAAAYQFFILNRSLLRGGHDWFRLLIIFIVQLFLIVDLVLLSVVDLETWLIPIETTLPWVAFGLILSAIWPELHASATAWTGSQRWDAVLDSLQGLVLGAGLLWTIGFLTTLFSFFYFKMRGIKERPKEGMGLGDCHLLGMLGALMGWKFAMSTLGLAVMIGATTGLGKVAWDKIQRRRLGDKYKPWQPTFEMPEAPHEKPYVPSFWPLAVMGILILVAVGFLWERSNLTFDLNLRPTLEETRTGASLKAAFIFDVRLIPVYLMALIGWLLIVAALFMKYLARIDMLPQGSIVEKSTGAKEEVLQGNYVPFGPSIALAALICVFYDPLIRAGAYWFAAGATEAFPALPYRVYGQDALISCFSKVAGAFNSLVRKTAGVG